MYPISPLYTDYLRRYDREFIVKATVNGVDYDASKVVDFSIENSLSLSSGFEIGTAIPSKLNIKLRTNEIIPANARIVPYLSLSLSGLNWLDAKYPWEQMYTSWTGTGTDWLPLGEFYVDSRERANDVWVFTCYDKLVFADEVFISSLTYPATQQAVFNEILRRMGWVADSSAQINSSYKIQAGPTYFTMRQVLSYIASANSASLFIGKDGKVKFKRFTAIDTPVFKMDASDYIQIKQTNPIKTYSRIVVTYDKVEGLTYEAGTGDENHTLYVENPFATQSITNGLLAALNGFSYLPTTIDSMGYPQLDQGDIIGFERYEGTSWEETVSTWDGTDIPWNGIVDYQTVILHQVYRFGGGLRMTIEAPSESEQQSEFPVQGTLTSAVNNLNKTAVKEGKDYYGVSITRSEGLLIEREDHKSKVILNSDKLSFQANGQDKLYFDPITGKYRFNGTLEATDGIFSGTLQAANGTFTGNLTAAGGTFTGKLVGVDGTFTGTVQAGKIIGGEITGTNITGADILGSRIRTASSGDRIELDRDGFVFYDSGNSRRVTLGTNQVANISGHTYYNSSGQSQGLIYASYSELHVVGNQGLLLAANGGAITLQGPVNFSNGSSITGLSITSISDLRAELNSIRALIANHTHSVTLPTHNHGRVENQNWGGTFTTSTP
ncbi:hypothetical protein J2Z69_000781 [Paenibacillus shirakamiensis]|uniref:Prophage tail endopeptidase domain-containing protein n=1 Tax=Paenibacillus shirakamiensis TaxID=1265935 RepID=A0ABS4JDG9_9BACL|nr:hypothetical protein [Paenibacillus shirakamiensis]MBP1999762.1 hypothetical protein [Paenibacillus shirakamiensis]